MRMLLTHYLFLLWPSDLSLDKIMKINLASNEVNSFKQYLIQGKSDFHLFINYPCRRAN